MAHAPKTRSEKAVLSARRAWCYLVLVLISFLCLFFFYILIVITGKVRKALQHQRLAVIGWKLPAEMDC